MKLRSNLDCMVPLKTLTTVQQLLGVMLVANLRHVQMIPVVIQHRNMFGKEEVFTQQSLIM